MSTILITFIPSILILFYFVLSDRFREPIHLIVMIFCLGVVICLPAGAINSFMHNNFCDGSKLSHRLFYSFFAPAWSEELLKFLVLWFCVLKRDEFNEPMDGIVYGVTVSLGFATFENFDYVFILSDHYQWNPLETAILRSYTAVPMHGLNGCIMGFFFGLYAFTAHKKYLILSLLIPYLFHGIYNFVDSPYYQITVGIMFVCAYILHSELKKHQRTMTEENELEKK